MKINDVPVICAECDHVKIIGNYLFCEKKHKMVYEAKPTWCPLPKLFVHEQITLADLLKGSCKK